MICTSRQLNSILLQLFFPRVVEDQIRSQDYAAIFLKLSYGNVYQRGRTFIDTDEIGSTFDMLDWECRKRNTFQIGFISV